MNNGFERRRIGDLQPSQLFYAFGVGAIVELPSLSAIVMGLDDWPVEHSKEVAEERLLGAVQRDLGPQVAELRTPPIPDDGNGGSTSPLDESQSIGVPVAPFPRWVVCPHCRLLTSISSGLLELKVDVFRKDRTRYVHRNCTKAGRPPTVVPARFLVACPKGHLSDFPWAAYVHGGETDCKYELRLYELGASGEVSDIQVECLTCGQKRRMTDAFSEEGREELGKCNRRWPHLRQYQEEQCKETSKAILLGASNSWFPVKLTVLSIPKAVEKLPQLVEQHWHVLDKLANVQNVSLLRQLGQLNAFTQFTDGEIWEAIENRRDTSTLETHDADDLKAPEWEAFSNPDPSLNGPDFRLTVVEPPNEYKTVIEKVVLAERLREVQALIGFTRIESPGDLSETELSSRSNMAPLARSKPTWVPAGDVRGEGIFIQFREDVVQQWASSHKPRDEEFETAHLKWREHRGLEPDGSYPHLRYILLHSFSHALMRQFTLECGYSAASLKERIYSGDDGGGSDTMAGVLLYTATPDSEGTLGGLVSLGRPEALGVHISQALENMKLCASDPLCAEHHPHRDSLTLHGAACHACLFASETSCERGNKYLDRSVLVPTVERDDIAFF